MSWLRTSQLSTLSLGKSWKLKKVGKKISMDENYAKSSWDMLNLSRTLWCTCPHPKTVEKNNLETSGITLLEEFMDESEP